MRSFPVDFTKPTLFPARLVKITRLDGVVLRIAEADEAITVSAQVYAATFNRPILFDPKPWHSREVIVYVETPLSVLNERWREEGGNEVFPMEMYARVIAEYERVLKDYRVVRVDGTKPVEHNVRFLLGALAIFWRPLSDALPGNLGSFRTPPV